MPWLSEADPRSPSVRLRMTDALASLRVERDYVASLERAERKQMQRDAATQRARLNDLGVAFDQRALGADREQDDARHHRRAGRIVKCPGEYQQRRERRLVRR